MGVCCCIVGRHARGAGSSTRPQMLGRRNGRTVSGCCVQVAEPGWWVTLLCTRPSRHVVVCTIDAACSSVLYASIASPQRVEKWKGEGIMGVHGHGTRESTCYCKRHTPCQEVRGGLYRRTTAYCSLLLYGSSAIQTSVTLVFLRHRLLDGWKRGPARHACSPHGGI